MPNGTDTAPARKSASGSSGTTISRSIASSHGKSRVPVKLQRRDFFTGGIAHRRSITRRVELIDLAHDDLQEADPHLDRSRGIAAQQALRLHVPRVAAFGLGPAARKDAAEGPALLVLYRRRPIGIEDVALVEDCAGDFAMRSGP